MNGLTMYRNVALLVLIALTSCVFSMPGREEMHAAQMKCAAEAGIDPVMMQRPPQFDEFADDPKIKCFHACMMKQHGAMNEDGTINVEKAIESLPPDVPDREKVIEAINECSTQKGENDCETAHAIFKCLRDNKALPTMRGDHRPRE